VSESYQLITSCCSLAPLGMLHQQRALLLSLTSGARFRS
jgi:hypothetical protein